MTDGTDDIPKGNPRHMSGHVRTHSRIVSPEPLPSRKSDRRDTGDVAVRYHPYHSYLAYSQALGPACLVQPLKRCNQRP